MLLLEEYYQDTKNRYYFMLISVSTFVPNDVVLNFKDKRLKWILYKVQWPEMRFGNKNELLLWKFYCVVSFSFAVANVLIKCWMINDATVTN